MTMGFRQDIENATGRLMYESCGIMYSALKNINSKELSSLT